MLSLQLDASLLEKTFAILSYSKALAIKHRQAQALEAVLSSKELLALVMLRLLEASSNSAQSLLTLMPISLSYSYATALLRA
ncbi:hypothetical protein HBI42_235890 [Parastagonospora nodorum]|nr:hypothetical protein HBI42_235890 [Parastagonospora nodorum]